MSNQNHRPSFIELAPMEGVIDYTMREMYSAIGGIDRCTTEFIRVSNTLLPRKVFLRMCPELKNGGKTKSGCPVSVQLLGDNPELMAANAQRAVDLGANLLSINFGCPAKTVNNRGGGSVLLQYPEKIHAITHAIRQAVPPEIPVTAKMRLGYVDKTLAMENALAIEAAGADELAIHARTKTEGYRPPAHWQEIGKISGQLKIPIIANGDIWDLDDVKNCQLESKTSRLMLGRSLIACPDLALLAKGERSDSLHWTDICLLLLHYFQQLEIHCPPQYINSLIKQWLVYLRMRYAPAHQFFDRIKKIREPQELQKIIIQELEKQQLRQASNGMIGRLDLTALLANYPYTL